MAEAILNKKGSLNFTAYTAGSLPTGHVNPEATKQLEAAGMPTAQLRSRSWDEFGSPRAPEMHFVFTVRDSAAAEVWPGVDRTPLYREALFLWLPLGSHERELIQREIDRTRRS